MNENLDFIRSIGVTDIPWHSLTGPYERGDAFPAWLAALRGEAGAADQAANRIAMHCEHQGTLWQVTPFGAVFVRRALTEALDAPDSPTRTADVLRLVNLLHVLYETVRETAGLEKPDPLPRFADLLDPQHLVPPATVDEDGEDDEDALLEAFYDNITEELFYSFFHYAWMVVALSMREDFPRARELGDPAILEALDRFSDGTANAWLEGLLA